jgi:hypothetical protein
MAERLVFVSYGQLTTEERALGQEVAQVVREHGMRPFIAQEVHSASDLNSNVFEAVRTCDAFLGILQQRGTVTFRDYPPTERSSVWIQQEFAMLCYRAFVEKRSIPMRVYAERGIRREGVMEIAMANPIEIDNPDEILADVDKWLGSPDFDEHPVVGTREGLFRRRMRATDDSQQLLLELVAAHCIHSDDFAQFPEVQRDFVAVLADEGIEATQANGQFGGAFEGLKNLGLLRLEYIRNSDDQRLWIPKQWWTLVLDEFRRRGRRL